MKDLFGSEPIKALSWKQPYASLMLPPNNKIETRTWKTNYRGLVLICASAAGYSWDSVQTISGRKQFYRILKMTDMKQPDRVAIAVGRLIDCRQMKESDENQCFVEYREPWFISNKKGQRVLKMLWCHIYADIRRIKPIPFKGGQGWQNVPQEIIKQIEFI